MFSCMYVHTFICDHACTILDHFDTYTFCIIMVPYDCERLALMCIHTRVADADRGGNIVAAARRIGNTVAISCRIGSKSTNF